MIASNDAGAEIVTHSLGSCLAVVVYDPGPRLGALLHVMLPDSTINPAKAQASPYMFVDTGVPRLFRAVCGLGANRSRLVVKVVGGAQFLNDNCMFNIGERNFQTLVPLLAKNGYAIHARDVGGKISRTVRLDMPTGKVTIQSPGLPPYSL